MCALLCENSVVGQVFRRWINVVCGGYLGGGKHFLVRGLELVLVVCLGREKHFDDCEKYIGTLFVVTKWWVGKLIFASL